MQRDRAAREVFVFAILEAAKRRKFYVLIPTLLLSAVALVFANRLPDLYRSEALVRAEPMATAHDFVDASGTSHANHVLNVDEQLRNVREIVTSEPILSRINREFALYPAAGARLTEQSLQDMRSRVIIRLSGGDEVRHSQPRFVSVQIGFEGQDPSQVTKVANRLVELFIAEASSDRARRVEEVEGFIEAEIQPLRKTLDEQTEKIRGYKQGAAAALPEQAATNLRLLETLQTEYMAKNEAIANDDARRAAIIRELNELEKQGALETIEAKEEQSPAEKRLEDLKIQYRELQTRYVADHPELRRVRKEMTELANSIPPRPATRGEHSPFYLRYLQLKGELESIDQRAKSFRNEQAQLVNQMQVYRARVESAPQHESALTELMRDYTATQTQYQEMLEKQQHARLARRFEKMSKEVVFRIIDPARIPLEPFTPQRERIILLGIFAGLGLGIALGVFVEHMDTSFEGVDDFQRSSDLPVMAVIPSIQGKARRNGSAETALVTVSAPHSIAAEQYRVLAMKLHNRTAGSRVIAVMSSAGAEGKTVTAINLAIALAGSTGGRVLLIDGDLRRPSVDDYLAIELEERRDFGELLADFGADYRAYLRYYKGISVIPGSCRSSDAVGLLTSSWARELFAALRKDFDYIVLDSPPILPIADSLVLAELSDEILLVLRVRRTPRELFEQAVLSLSAGNIRGVVLNDVKYQYSRYAYAYKYYQKNYLARH
jgi:polysaccharide chain length determinant protein (PEP-CTERM system associated)